MAFHTSRVKRPMAKLLTPEPAAQAPLALMHPRDRSRESASKAGSTFAKELQTRCVRPPELDTYQASPKMDGYNREL